MFNFKRKDKQLLRAAVSYLPDMTYDDMLKNSAFSKY